MAGLRELWDEVIPDAGELADTLVRRYSGRRTAYRDQYLTTVLDALDALEQLATDPVAVRLAVWFHRAVHAAENTAQEDAEASAQLAEELLPRYGVNGVRTAEVARLIRLREPQDANGEVFLDAVDAVLADRQYGTFASEIRRDSRFDLAVRREWIQAALASERLYRTDLAHDRYEQAARANLTAELELLDGMTPHPWRGWQHTGLAVLAVLTAFVGFVAAAASTGQPWRNPSFGDGPGWAAITMTVLAAVSVAVLWWAVRRSASRIVVAVPAVPAVIGLAGMIAILRNVPPSTGSSGAGQRVPLLMITSVLLIVASGVAVAATRFRRGTTWNHGRLLAAAAAIVVVVLATLLVIDPIQRAYLVSANEYVENLHQPADLNVASVVDGNVLWKSPGGAADSGSLVATAGGIAIARGRGAVEMVDPATGRTRWRYLRADTDDRPILYALNGGHQVLVSYDDLGYFVLDADTGRRTATWPAGDRDYDIENNDPLITGKSVSKGSDKLSGTGTDGSDRWTYEPGRCITISATGAAGLAVASLNHSCGDTSQLVGLDLKTGKKRWSRDGSLDFLTTAGDLVLGVETLSGDRRQLKAIDPRTGADQWTADLPPQWHCTLTIAWTGRRIVLANCPSAAQASSETVVRFLDPTTGRTTATTNAGVPWRDRLAVTADGRVFAMGRYGERSCRLVKITEGAAPEHLDLGPDARCDGATAAGNLLLISTRDSLIALR